MGSIVLGLALQDTFSALFSGFSLVSSRQFKEGDWLEVGGDIGKIIHVTWRTVTLLNLDEDIITFMTTNDEKLAKNGDKNTYIPAKYIDILTSSFIAYEKIFVDEYKTCLEVYPFPVREGAYLFTDSMQQKIARDGIAK